MDAMLSTRFAIVIRLQWTAVAVLSGCAPRATDSAPAPMTVRTSGCTLSSFHKSTLAWESGLAQGRGPATPVGRDGVAGRVIAVRNGEPVLGATVILDPLPRSVKSDSSGRFAFPAVPQGRYRLRIHSSAGFVSDSVTVGFDGLRVLAALTTHRGDLICTPR